MDARPINSCWHIHVLALFIRSPGIAPAMREEEASRSPLTASNFCIQYDAYEVHQRSIVVLAESSGVKPVLAVFSSALRTEQSGEMPC